MNGKFPVNIKVLIEERKKLAASVCGTMFKRTRRNESRRAGGFRYLHARKGVPSITYGLRGLNYYQIELTGPARDLHSGVYGGAVPNPLMVLDRAVCQTAR